MVGRSWRPGPAEHSVVLGVGAASGGGGEAISLDDVWAACERLAAVDASDGTEAGIGLGRIVVLCHRPSTLYQMC
jgi:hypothetical protein